MVDEEVAGDDIYHEDLQCHPDLNYPGFYPYFGRGCFETWAWMTLGPFVVNAVHHDDGMA